MKEMLIVGFGGLAGSVLRYKAGGLVNHVMPAARLPWGTILVNILGCLLIGAIAVTVERLSAYNAELRLLLITGFLGGFTTFSAFSLETYHLIRAGDPLFAVVNILLSVFAGLLAVWCGMWFAQHLG